MRSIPLENVSKKQTTSCGPLNCLLHEVEWRKRPPILQKVEMLATGKTRSTGLLEGWTKVSTRIIIVIWLINNWNKQTKKQHIKWPYHKRSILQIKPKQVTFKSTNKTEFNNHKKNCIAQQSTNYPRYAESVQHSRVSQHNPLYINKLKRKIKWSYQ